MNKKGFTLAEVLVTLGIIGVIAAMTLPAVISKYKTKEAGSRLKKFYSALSQAILLSENDNGPISGWEKQEMAYDEDGNLMNEEQSRLALVYFNKYLKPYLKYIKIDENPKDGTSENADYAHMIKVYLADGSTFLFNNGSCAHIIFDINGNKLPNSSGYDIYSFLICPDSVKNSICQNNKSFCPWGNASDNTREKALITCKIEPHKCANLLIMDNWEFKEDYPYKL